MLDWMVFIEVIIAAFIVLLTMSIIWYAAINRAIKGILTAENVQVFTDSALDYLVNTEEGQKNLYTVGALIGNGVKTGVGLQKQGGARGFNGLLAEIVSGFFSARQQGISESTQSPALSPPTRQPTPVRQM